MFWLAISPFTLNAENDRNWPQFRGPNGDGMATDAKLPSKLTEGENLRWKIPISGRGWSSPVIWGNRIWLTTAPQDGKQLFAICVDFRSGKTLHRIKVFDVVNPRFRHATNSYASCTPVIEEGRIYVHFGSYGTACLDTETGKKIWERRDLPCNHFRGPGSSPILFKNLLILTFDGFDYQYVTALDKTTGKTVWKKDRNISYGTDNGDYKKAYSTPSVFKTKKRNVLVSPSAVETVAYNPENGNELWRVRHGGMNAAAKPIFGHNLIYITAGEGASRLIAVRPGGSGNVTDSHVIWRKAQGIPRRPSQLLIGDLLLMIADNGVASCLDAKTGKKIWQKRFSGAFWASPIFANGKIYCFSKEGKVVVVKARRKFEQISEGQFESGFNASPAVKGNSIVLRTFHHLYRIEK